MNFLSTLGYGGQVMVIGLCVVFIGLGLLILCIWLMAKLFKAAEKARARKAQPQAEPIAAPVVEPEPAPVEVAQPETDAQLIAVIAAAIAAFDNSGKNLVIRKVRRVPGWNGAARQEQIYRF